MVSIHSCPKEKIITDSNKTLLGHHRFGDWQSRHAVWWRRSKLTVLSKYSETSPCRLHASHIPRSINAEKYVVGVSYAPFLFDAPNNVREVQHVTICDLRNLSDDVWIHAVDNVRSSKLCRKRQSGRDDVDCNDSFDVERFGRHQRCDSNSSHAENCDRVLFSRLEYIKNTSGPSLYSTLHVLVSDHLHKNF